MAGTPDRVNRSMTTVWAAWKLQTTAFTFLVVAASMLALQSTIIERRGQRIARSLSSRVVQTDAESDLLHRHMQLAVLLPLAFWACQGIAIAIFAAWTVKSFTRVTWCCLGVVVLLSFLGLLKVLDQATYFID